jgi:proteasome accessory factor A
LLFGRDLTEGRDTCVHLPIWLESALQWVTRIVTAPLALALYCLLQVAAFVDVRRKLLPFLVSRPVLTGAGLLDEDGQFQLADKGPSINCVVGFGGIIGDRPIFTMGHFFKAVYAESWFSPREYWSLFANRQRLQIAIGDSNMSETAQLLRVGATALILDALDAGFFGYAPRLRSPIGALRAICADPTLRGAVSLVGEKSATALELQRFYYSACRAFIGSQPDVPRGAWEVLGLWKQALDDLELVASGGEPPRRLIGAVDWVTKKYLLDHAAPNSTWEERKKIDIRYHELSPEGYFEMLRAAGLIKSVIGEAAVERATRTPPANSPATMRGHYIREFGASEERFAVNWKAIIFGHGWRKRVIRLSQYGRTASPARPPRSAPRGRPRRG